MRLTVDQETKLVMLYVVNYINLKDKVLIGLNCLRAFGLTHDREFNITNFDRTFIIRSSINKADNSVNLVELNQLLKTLESEGKESEAIEANNQSKSELDLMKAINHIVINEVSELELAINPELDETVKERLLAILKRYETVFAKDKYDTGLIEGFECAFNTADNIPVNLRPYKISYKDECMMENIVDEWIKRGIVRERATVRMRAQHCWRIRKRRVRAD